MTAAYVPTFAATAAVVWYEDINIWYIIYSSQCSHEYGSLDFPGMKSCVNGAI